MGELRAIAIGVFAVLISACGAKGEPRWAGDPESLVPELCGDVPKAGEGALPANAVELRDTGMKALREGDFVVASEHFGEAIDLAPGNVALVALHAVANDGLRVAAKETGEEYDKERPVKLELVTEEKLAGPMGEPVAVRDLGTVSYGEKEDLRAVGQMFSRNQVPQVLRRVYSLRKLAVHEDRGVLTYVRNQRHLILQVGPESGKARIADYGKFDDKRGVNPVVIYAAAFAVDAIYTAMMAKGDMAIYAHNRHNGEAIWRTPSTNVRAIDVVGDRLVAVNNKDLLVIDRHTGRQLAKHTTGLWTNQLVVRDGYVFAVAGGEAKVFELGPGRGTWVQNDESLAGFIKRVSGNEEVSPPNVFATAPDAAVDIAPEHACGVKYALAELDAGRYDAAAKRLTRMERVYPHHPVVLALTATSRFMQRNAGETIDFSAVRARAFSRMLPPKPTHDVEAHASLIQVSTRPAENLRRWASRSGVSRYSVDPDVLPESIPRHYGRFEISEWNGDGEGGHVVIYGLRYVVLIRGEKVEAAFDGKTLFDEKGYPGSTSGFVHLAMRRADKLFITFSDKRSQRGLASIDIGTGRVGWRTSSILQPIHFAVARDHIVATWGRKLFVLRPTDGVVIGELQLRDSPRAMASAGGRILVNSFSGSDEFTITNSVAVTRKGG